MFREMTKSHNVHMTNANIMQQAPSVFSEAPRDDVSDRYGFIPTIQVVDELRNTGWFPVDATQKNVRKKENTDFTKHLVRFRKLENDIMVGDSAVELLLTNSHDRSSGFILHAGLFRMACANGIVIADSTFQKVSIRHNQNAPGEVIEGSYSVIDQVPLITDAVEAMQQIQLTDDERKLLANTAFNYSQHKAGTEILTAQDNIAQQILRPMRQEDTGNDLWTTFNQVQERIINGGIRTLRKNEKGKITRNKTRAVKSIDKDLKLNKALWEMAVQMQDLKAA